MTRKVCSRFFCLATAAAVVLAYCGVSSAQSNSMFGAGSSIGRAPSSSGGTTGRSQGSSGGSTSSSSLFNPTDFSLNIGGQVRSADASRNGSTLVGDSFIGRSEDTNNFIGRRSQNGTGNAAGNGATRRITAANGQGRNGNAQNRQRQFNQNGNNQFNQNNNNSNNNNRQQANSSQPKRMVTRHRIDFPTAPVSEAAVESKLDTRFHGMITDRIKAKDLKFELDPEGVLVMHGEVDSAHDKALAALIASMEPGVHGVRNELDVAAPASKPAEPQ